MIDCNDAIELVRHIVNSIPNTCGDEYSTSCEVAISNLYIILTCVDQGLFPHVLKTNSDLKLEAKK